MDEPYYLFILILPLFDLGFITPLTPSVCSLDKPPWIHPPSSLPGRLSRRSSGGVGSQPPSVYLLSFRGFSSSSSSSSSSSFVLSFRPTTTVSVTTFYVLFFSDLVCIFFCETVTRWKHLPFPFPPSPNAPSSPCHCLPVTFWSFRGLSV
jgi:hypothetical protein